MNALLIDDEVSARNDLRLMLAAHPAVRIVGEAALIDEARPLLRAAAYELVFLDVQLLGGTGFDLVPDVRPGARIVFVSAYDTFALRAFEVNALDYLLKPVRAARLAEALGRLPPGEPPTAAVEPGALAITDLVHLKTGLGTGIFTPVSEIVAISSEDNYTQVTLADGTRHLVRQSLSVWDRRLPASHFMRVHRQAIANVSRIARFAHLDDEVTLLHLGDHGCLVRARRQHWPELVQRMSAFVRRL